MAQHSERSLVRTRYSDFKIDFDPHPITGDLLVASNADSVKRSIRNLLLTGTYERMYRPYIGSGLQKYLFELVTPVNAYLIERSIITTINNFEPRAKLVSVVVNVMPDENGYTADVSFRILNLPEVFTFKEILRRVR